MVGLNCDQFLLSSFDYSLRYTWLSILSTDKRDKGDIVELRLVRPSLSVYTHWVRVLYAIVIVGYNYCCVDLLNLLYGRFTREYVARWYRYTAHYSHT